MEEKTMDHQLAIVILNWNGADMLRRFLPSVQASLLDGCSLYVADNGSTDHSCQMMKQMFPSVHLLELNQNYGFADGYNMALKQVKAKYYLLLNSDVEVDKDWLRPLLQYMEAHTDVAACQPKLLSQRHPESFEYAGACGGYLDAYGYPFCRGRVMGTVETDQGQYDEVADVLWASGAALMVRSEAYWKVGGLDGRFFAHMEEIDLCWRMACRGYRLVCVPQSKVFHVGGATLKVGSPQKTYLNFRNNLLMLYKNLPAEDLARVMRIRGLLDAVAALQFTLKGQWVHAKAVWRARRDYAHLQKEFTASRQENQRLMVTAHPYGLTAYSVLFRYYLRGKHTFAQLLK